MQGWKLQAVRLSGTGKNEAGQVKVLDTFPRERLKLWESLSVCMSRTGKNSAGQVNVFHTFPKKRLKYFVISTPAVMPVSVPTGRKNILSINRLSLVHGLLNVPKAKLL